MLNGNCENASTFETALLVGASFRFRDAYAASLSGERDVVSARPSNVCSASIAVIKAMNSISTSFERFKAPFLRSFRFGFTESGREAARNDCRRGLAELDSTADVALDVDDSIEIAKTIVDRTCCFKTTPNLVFTSDEPYTAVVLV